MKFQYANPAVPSDYKCGQCGAKGVKLWRLYNVFLDHQKLFCCDCAAIDQRKKTAVARIDSDGRVPYERFGGRGDQIGSLIPAVPTEENDTFWGYTSVPQPGVEWWRALPNRKTP